jgi:hypothetical protein
MYTAWKLATKHGWCDSIEVTSNHKVTFDILNRSQAILIFHMNIRHHS